MRTLSTKLMTLAFLGFMAPRVVSADVVTPESGLQLDIADIFTIGGNIAENAVRSTLAEALKNHTLNDVSISTRTVDGITSMTVVAHVGQAYESAIINSVQESLGEVGHRVKITSRQRRR